MHNMHSIKYHIVNSLLTTLLNQKSNLGEFFRIYANKYLEIEMKTTCQSSQLAQFSTYNTKLQNKQYHFKAPQVESHDV